MGGLTKAGGIYKCGAPGAARAQPDGHLEQGLGARDGFGGRTPGASQTSRTPRRRGNAKRVDAGVTAQEERAWQAIALRHHVRRVHAQRRRIRHLVVAVGWRPR